MPKKFSRDEIIAHFQAVHGERYDYSQVVYKNTVTKITVVCTSHGSFEIAPGHHKNGTGCAKCYFASQRISRADFIARSREQHGDRYDYDLVPDGLDVSADKVTLRCNFHDDTFEQSANNHMYGHRGCAKCVALSLTGDAATRGELKSQDELNNGFIDRAMELHNGRYGYERVVYAGVAAKIEIICRIHGPFEQIAGNHLKGAGCPECNRLEAHSDSFKQKCVEMGVDYYRALKRREAGMSDEHIFERETLRHLRRVNEVAVDGHDYPNLGAAVRHIRPPATATTIARWLADGMTPEEAFTRVPNPGVKDGAIYLITHRESGKKYVGLTVQSIERRWTYHQQQAQAGWIKSLEGLHAAIRRFGPDAFVVERIDSGKTKIDLEAKERAWIKRHDSLVPAGFNISTGGGSGGVGAKPVTIDGLPFASSKLGATYLAETRGISYEAAKKRLSSGRIDVRKPAAKGESLIMTSAYKAWSRIRHGVLNPNSKEFIEGVHLHPAWYDSQAFMSEVGQPPKSGMSFVRIDKTLGYVPGNCRWIDRSEAARLAANYQASKRSSRA